MTLKDIKDNQSIVLECISGSRAYGLELPHSDTDYKGVFILPEKEFFGLRYTEQINNETNDISFFELRKFFDLLSKNNPAALELIGTPEESIIFRHPLLERIRPEIFLSRLCRNTFAGYAKTQVHRARGLNKKIVNPIAAERKRVIDFCYVPSGQGSLAVKIWLSDKGLIQEKCGLAGIPHMKDFYGIYYDTDGYGFSGIVKNENSNDVSLSSIPKGLEKIGLMYFNREGYSKYCKDYKEYFEWVEKRNEERYNSTLEHGKNYDAKNMMHTFRLLHMAEEIARSGRLIVKRPDRELLLSIRSGKCSYEELVSLAEEKASALEELYEKSNLPEAPDLELINELLHEIRKKFYDNFLK